MGPEDVNLYESPLLREFTAPVIRPGGLELTARGLALCRLAPGARILDVGCGTGAAVDYLRRQGLAAIGIDFSEVLLEKGSRTYGTTPLVRARAEQLPMGDGCAGAVLCECVLSLCGDPVQVLKEMRRVLKKGGYLVLTDVYSRKVHGAAPTGRPAPRCCLKGAVARSTAQARITHTGFDLLLWEDHSQRLKQLAARLAWSYGSLDAFWSAVDGSAAAVTLHGSGAGECSAPGYYLLVAQKKR
jgi:SAM-dependent methyltransferase